jgi:outer membrane immunogenic protein
MMRLNKVDRAIDATVGVAVRIILAGICMLISAVTLRAQTPAPTVQFGLDPGQIAVMELGVDYAYFHANAPPGKCGCFSLQGVGGGFAINGEHGFSAVVDLSTANANAINGTTQNIRIFNILGGPRYSFRSKSKFTPYGQVLVGASQEFSTDAFATNQNAFAVSGGAGVNHALGRYFGWKIVEASYLYSQLRNGSNDHQNDLRISTGIFLRMGPR